MSPMGHRTQQIFAHLLNRMYENHLFTIFENTVLKVLEFTKKCLKILTDRLITTPNIFEYYSFLYLGFEKNYTLAKGFEHEPVIFYIFWSVGS